MHANRLQAHASSQYLARTQKESRLFVSVVILVGCYENKLVEFVFRISSTLCVVGK